MNTKSANIKPERLEARKAEINSMLKAAIALSKSSEFEASLEEDIQHIATAKAVLDGIREASASDRDEARASMLDSLKSIAKAANSHNITGTEASAAFRLKAEMAGLPKGTRNSYGGLIRHAADALKQGSLTPEAFTEWKFPAWQEAAASPGKKVRNLILSMIKDHTVDMGLAELEAFQITVASLVGTTVESKPEATRAEKVEAREQEQQRRAA